MNEADRRYNSGNIYNRKALEKTELAGTNRKAIGWRDDLTKNQRNNMSILPIACSFQCFNHRKAQMKQRTNKQLYHCVCLPDTYYLYIYILKRATKQCVTDILTGHSWEVEAGKSNTLCTLQLLHLKVPKVAFSNQRLKQKMHQRIKTSEPLLF